MNFEFFMIGKNNFIKKGLLNAQRTQISLKNYNKKKIYTKMAMTL